VPKSFIRRCFPNIVVNIELAKKFMYNLKDIKQMAAKNDFDNLKTAAVDKIYSN